MGEIAGACGTLAETASVFAIRLHIGSAPRRPASAKGRNQRVNFEPGCGAVGIIRFRVKGEAGSQLRRDRRRGGLAGLTKVAASGCVASSGASDNRESGNVPTDWIARSLQARGDQRAPESAMDKDVATPFTSGATGAAPPLGGAIARRGTAAAGARKTDRPHPAQRRPAIRSLFNLTKPRSLLAVASSMDFFAAAMASSFLPSFARIRAWR